MKTLLKISAFSLLLLLFACHTKEGFDLGYGSVALSGDVYTEYEENPFVNVADAPISTFSVDADGASYANVRRFLMQESTIPPKGAIRTEEMINYFDLDYPFDNPGHAIALNGEVSDCPWQAGNQLIRIGIEGKPLSPAAYPASNFVLLIDVSGSMSSDDKLDLLKDGFTRFVDEMRPQDRIAIVTYAGRADVPLSSTSGDEKDKIKKAIKKLDSGGSTAGTEGIITAYEIAEQHFVAGGNNRIIIGTDGDFNVGPSSLEETVELIEEKRETGIFLTVLGVGRGNLNDARLEQLADNGNGTYEYIDNQAQLEKVFIHDFAKFYTVAKDVKVQVEFNADFVEAYRLIGYENRLLDTEDFENDSTDAGEIGAGQNITALYEIRPVASTVTKDGPVFTVDFRYKEPDADTSIPLSMEVPYAETPFSAASDQMRFTASIASFAMLLGESIHKGSSTYDDTYIWLDDVNLPDPHGFKAELKQLVLTARDL